MSAYRGTLTHQHSTASRHSCPAQARLYSRHRPPLKFRSDSVSQYSGRTVTPYHHQFCRKARSAENLRNSKLSYNCSFEDSRETRSSNNLFYTSGHGMKQQCSLEKEHVRHPPNTGVKFKLNRCVNSSLESCRGSSLPVSTHETRAPLLLDAGFRGRSLDSASATSARRLADGRVTPELRVSPPPPSPKELLSPRLPSNKSYFSYMNKYNSPCQSPTLKEPTLVRSSTGYSHGRPFGLQRQEPIEETFFPPHYPTLTEEEEEDIYNQAVRQEEISQIHQQSTSFSTESELDPNSSKRTSKELVGNSIHTPGEESISANSHSGKSKLLKTPPLADEEFAIADSKEEEEERNLPSKMKRLQKCTTLDTPV